MKKSRPAAIAVRAVLWGMNAAAMVWFAPILAASYCDIIPEQVLLAGPRSHNRAFFIATDFVAQA